MLWCNNPISFELALLCSIESLEWWLLLWPYFQLEKTMIYMYTLGWQNEFYNQSIGNRHYFTHLVDVHPDFCAISWVRYVALWVVTARVASVPRVHRDRLSWAQGFLADAECLFVRDKLTSVVRLRIFARILETVRVTALCSNKKIRHDLQ